MIHRKSNFTLLEILLVLAILSLVAGVVGFGFVRERGQQQFNNEIAALQQKLQAAELLMQLYHETVTVNIEGTTVTIQTDIPLNKIYQHIFNEHKNLSSLSTIAFITPDGERIEGRISLVFSAIHQSIPRGTLLVQKGNEVRSFVLAGYVHPITVDNGLKMVRVEDETNQYPQNLEELQ